MFLTDTLPRALQPLDHSRWFAFANPKLFSCVGSLILFSLFKLSCFEIHPLVPSWKKNEMEV
jgi:hypothetical protein